MRAKDAPLAHLICARWKTTCKNLFNRWMKKKTTMFGSHTHTKVASRNFKACAPPNLMDPAYFKCFINYYICEGRCNLTAAHTRLYILIIQLWEYVFFIYIYIYIRWVVGGQLHIYLFIHFCVFSLFLRIYVCILKYCMHWSMT